MGNEYSPVLGRAWIRHLKIKLEDLDKNPSDTSNVFSVQADMPTVDKLKNRFPTVFKQSVGKVPGVKCSLTLRDGSKPVFLKARPVPYSLHNKVEAELQVLEEDGVISKIKKCDWGSPIVIVPKAEGKIRIIADYKQTVNPQLLDAHYPIPRQEEVIDKFQNSRYYCKLDIYGGYPSIPVDDESSLIQAITTHLGVFKVHRLGQGLKTAPSHFH